MIKKPPIERFWVRCPLCGAKADAIFDNTANISGLYLVCKRGCRREFEVKIINGKQAH